MKIAMIGQKGIPAKSGGIEKHVESLSWRLSNMGHRVYVYTRPYYSSKKPKGSAYKNIKLIPIYSLKTKHFDTASYTFLASLHAIFKIKDLDVIHYHGIGPSLFSWLPRLIKPRLKVVSTFHCQDYYHKKWSLPARLLLRLGEMFSVLIPHETIVVSKVLKRYVKNTYNKTVQYIPNATEPRKNKKINSKIIKQKWNLTANNYFLTVNRLVKHKGIHTLIVAYNNLNPKIQAKKKLVIVGSPSYTDNYLLALKKLANNNPNIIFTGQQVGKKLEVLFKNAYAYIHPSESEGLSLSLLEAMHYGLPILTSNIPENIEPIKNIGLVFRNKNASDLYRKLNKLLSLDKKKIKKMAIKSQKRSVDRYNWDDVALKTEKLYQKILSPKPRISFNLKTKKI